MFKNCIEDGKKYLLYSMNLNDAYDYLGINILNNNENNYLIRPMISVEGNNRKISYDITGYIPLSVYMDNFLSKNEVISILNCLESIYSDVLDYMLEEKNLYLNNDYIFINSADNKLKMIYSPVEQEKSFANLKNYIKNLLSKIKYSGYYDYNFFKEVLDYMEKDSFELSEFMGVLSNIRSKIKSIKTDIEKINAHIVRVKTLEQFDIKKEKVVLGKSKKFDVDWSIDNNKTISRVHAGIEYYDNGFYVIDYFSSNGTYLNNQNVFPNEPCLLKNGDIITMSNEDFKFFS